MEHQTSYTQTEGEMKYSFSFNWTSNNLIMPPMVQTSNPKYLKAHYSFCCPLLLPSAGQTQRSQALRLKDSATPLQVRDSTAASIEDFPCKDHTAPSYQQISCLDSVIR